MVYRLKRPWSDGTTDLVFEPQDFIAKLAALVPAPRVHLTRFHGILAPAAKWRPLIIPTPIVEPDILSSAGPLPAPESGEGSEASIPEEATPNRPHSRRNYTWARLMMRVFQLDVLQCECGGRLRILASIHPPDTTRKILDCLGLPYRAPPLSPAVSEAPLDYS